MKKKSSATIYLFISALIAVLGIAAIYTNRSPIEQHTTQAGSNRVSTSERQAALLKHATGEMAAFDVKKSPTLVPEFSFKDGTGKKLMLSDFKGKVVLLNVWATWCAPCLVEMPTLDCLQQSLGGENFEVLALSIDMRGAKAAQKMLDKLNVANLKLYIDKSTKASRPLGVKGMPTTLLIDENGFELGRLSGPANWDSVQAKGLIKTALLNKNTTPPSSK